MSAGAVVGDVAGRLVPLHYGDATTEYMALREHCVMIDRSHRGRLRLSGPKASEMLTGLVTNDILALQPGHGCYAAALTAKGKIVADVRVFVEHDAVLVDAPSRAAESWLAMVKKFVNPRLAPHTDEREATRDLGVFGPDARHVVADATGLSPALIGNLPPYGHVAGVVEHTPVTVARVPDAGVDGYEIFLPAALFPQLWERLRDARIAPAGLDAWDIARIEAGRPEWGIDIDETTIPQEANFDELEAVSYTKGCYVGQETVARVHFRGHVNRHLRGLRFGEPPLPASNAELLGSIGEPVGHVRSAAHSPRLGVVALAMVRREVPAGATVTARWTAGEGQAVIEQRAEVVILPFPSKP
ncbi:MAG: glycine cleavage T C-terminal barrel domain-containing protein [Gemmatimonadaceae bacterium]